VGTLVPEFGPKLFEPANVDVCDDDLVVAHLSDLHVSDRYRYRLSWPGNVLNDGEPSAAEILAEDLDSLGLLGRLDALIISGDIVWNGSIDEFNRARQVIKELLEATKLSPDQLLLIPGNHDVQWNPAAFAAKDKRPNVSRESYRTFLELLGGDSRENWAFLCVSSRSGQHRLRVVGLDSNSVEGPEAAGIGYVAREELLGARSLFERDLGEVKGQDFRWLAVHHHVLPATSATLDEAREKRISVMANSAEVQGCAARWGVDLILHGHEHQPSITVARTWPVDRSRRFVPVTTVGAGSFSVKRDCLGPFSRNHYYLIYRRPQEILIRSRCTGNNGVVMVGHEDVLLPR
jgi:3',5'-cyclic AMP phosphodiesterase CpdA